MVLRSEQHAAPKTSCSLSNSGSCYHSGTERLGRKAVLSSSRQTVYNSPSTPTPLRNAGDPWVSSLTVPVTQGKVQGLNRLPPPLQLVGTTQDLAFFLKPPN